MRSTPSNVGPLPATAGGADFARAEVQPAMEDAHPSSATRAAVDEPTKSCISRCVMLAGGLRPSPLMREAHQSVLDLHLSERQRVFDLWMQRLAELADDARPFDLRIAWNSHCPMPTHVTGTDAVSVRLVQEEDGFRGPAGTARDICVDCGEEDHVLVVESGRYFDADLGSIAREHAEADADATIVCNRNEAPAGIYVLRAAALALAPARGFMDLKEQLLAKVHRRGMRVRVHRLRHAVSLPLMTRLQFLEAVRRASGQRCSADGDVHEDAIFWRQRPPHWRVLCEGAQVHEEAVVVDSVVMPGASIAAGAVVARSVICPGARVALGEITVDRVMADARRGVGR